MYKLILIRHGQSEWNLSNQFTGWTDVDLTPLGVEEAKKAGRILRDEPGLDIRYQDIKFKAARPATESLMDATKRIIPLWNVNIVESLREYKQVMVVAHGNSIRGIIKFMKNMSNEDIVKLNIPTGVPYLLELDNEMQVISDRYLGLSEDELKAKQEGVANQTKA